MSDLDLLREFRLRTQEASQLAKQLESLEAQEDEEDDAQAAQEAYLRRQLTAAQARCRQLDCRFDEVVLRASNARQRLILRQYYGAAMTDSGIACSIGCSRKAVNRMRNKFVRECEEKGQAEMTEENRMG